MRKLWISFTLQVMGKTVNIKIMLLKNKLEISFKRNVVSIELLYSIKVK